ncbi:hypothetical protein [Pseudoalteromonas maricaloris]|uniref:hypothetical protein n=1 Tax=Pseudoalteromonas maricaloris TaxID=184924 RepID=UPI00029A57DD|nr:hypothetical protein [Pseudoalteromonas flavipulchra]
MEPYSDKGIEHEHTFKLGSTSFHTVKDFFCSRSNWFYFSVISLVFMAGLLFGIPAPLIYIDINFKQQPPADWLVAIGTLGLWYVAFVTRNQWLAQRDLENHANFLMAFYQYFLLKTSCKEQFKKELKLQNQIKAYAAILTSVEFEKKSEVLKLIESTMQELETLRAIHKDIFKEVDQAKERMLVKASIMRVKRKELHEYAMTLATYQMEQVVIDFDKFRSDMNDIYLRIQRFYFSDEELVHLPFKTTI